MRATGRHRVGQAIRVAGTSRHATVGQPAIQIRGGLQAAIHSVFGPGDGHGGAGLSDREAGVDRAAHGRQLRAVENVRTGCRGLVDFHRDHVPTLDDVGDTDGRSEKRLRLGFARGEARVGHSHSGGKTVPIHFDAVDVGDGAVIDLLTEGIPIIQEPKNQKNQSGGGLPHSTKKGSSGDFRGFLIGVFEKERKTGDLLGWELGMDPAGTRQIAIA